jgi:murein DD-endopeptidase MepM/ murein hydrolase activator NlpD
MVLTIRHAQRRAERALRRADHRITALRKIRRLGPAQREMILRRSRRLTSRLRQTRARETVAAKRSRLAHLDLERMLNVRPDPRGRQTTAHARTWREARQLTTRAQRLASRVRTLERRTRRRSRAVRSGARARSLAERRIGRATARRETAEAWLGDQIARMVRIARPMANEGIHAHPGPVRFSWPARGLLTQVYGCTGFRLEPRRGRCRHFHHGIDIAAHLDAPIRAAASGVVAYVGWDPWDRGRRSFMVILVHRGGSETLYGHLRPRRRVRSGEVVRRGDVIGSMGNTGRSTGVHLYFAISHGFRVRNPLAVLPPES